MEKLMVLNHKHVSETVKEGGPLGGERGGDGIECDENGELRHRRRRHQLHHHRHHNILRHQRNKVPLLGGHLDSIDGMWDSTKLDLQADATIEGFTVADFAIMDSNSVHKIFGERINDHTNTAHILQSLTQTAATKSITRFNFASLMRVLQNPTNKKQTKSANIYTWAPINTSMELATILDNTKRVISKQNIKREDSVKRNAKYLKFDQKTPGEIAIWTGKRRNCKHGERVRSKKCVVSQPDTQFTRTTNSTFNNFTLELNDALMTPRFPRLNFPTQRSHVSLLRNATGGRGMRDYADMKFDLGVVKLPNISARKQKPYPLMRVEQPETCNARKHCILSEMSVQNSRKEKHVSPVGEMAPRSHYERREHPKNATKHSKIIILTPAPPPASPVTNPMSSVSSLGSQ